MTKVYTTLILVFTLSLAAAWTLDRRQFFQGVAIATGTVVATDVAPALASEDTQDVYFGVGCFWHIQHEFAVAERDLLGRNGGTLSCKTGYAGGNGGTDKQGRVCYHNFQGIADYGKLGHGEVVGMTLPKDKVLDFSKVYFGLFNPTTKGTHNTAARSICGLLILFPQTASILGIVEENTGV